MEKYYKNFILCGELNYCCLLCQEGFMCTAYVDKHLQWDEHKDIVKKQEYIPKFRKDFIYKIPEGRYYCEICNEVFKKVEAHLKKETHQDLKKSKTSKKRPMQVAYYLNRFTVQISNEKITQGKWHSIVEDKCLLCGKPFGSLVDHVTSYNHLVRLIECETILENGNPYRKQGTNVFYCFICFKVYEKDALDAHWTECHHNIQRIREEKENRENTKKALTTTKDNPNMVMINGKDKCFNFDESHKLACVQCDQVLDLKYETLESHAMKHMRERSLKLFKVYYLDKNKSRVEMGRYLRINENISLKTFFQYFIINASHEPECLKCQKVVDFKSDEIETHIRRHQRQRIPDCGRNLKDEGKRRADLADYGRKNFITLNRGGSMSYCTLCTVYVSAHIKKAQEHIKGSLHRGHLELRGFIEKQKHEVLPYETIPQINFIKQSRGPFTIGDNTFTCINDNICVTAISEALMSENYNFDDNVYKCYCCNEVIDVFCFTNHIRRKKHLQCTLNFKVLLLPKNDDVEFIREFRPNLYHCGYCNKIYPFWENLKKHLTTIRHKENRMKAKQFYEVCEKLYDEYPNLIGCKTTLS